jgi:hypothetical protein
MRKSHANCRLLYLSNRRLITLVIILAGTFIISCNKLPFNDQFTEVIYVQTNNYMKSMNAIIAYRNNGDGKLMPVLGGPFYTGGSGITNYDLGAGPNESDGEIRISNDKQYLLTVNSGSNTVAVFRINLDGTLSPVAGSPFPSGGATPVSIDMWQQYVIVLNKGSNPLDPIIQKPNYTIFRLEGNGALSPVPGGTYELPAGVSPAQVMVSKTHPFVFGSNFLAYDVTPNYLRTNTFTIANSGILTPVPDTPDILSWEKGAFGICQNRKYDVLYISYAYSSRLGVYDINPGTGKLNYLGDMLARPGCSRLCINNANTWLYTANTIVNSITPVNISNPRVPQPNFYISLKNPGPIFNQTPGSPYSGNTSSECVSLAPSSDDKYVYVVSQHANRDLSIGNYNFLHVLTTGGANALAEPDEPIQLPVPNNIRPRGLAVLRLN